MHLLLEYWLKACTLWYVLPKPFSIGKFNTSALLSSDLLWWLIWIFNVVVVNNRICRGGLSILKWRPIQSCWLEGNEDQRENKIKDTAFYIFWPQSTVMNEVPSSSSCSFLRLFKWPRGRRQKVPSHAVWSRWTNKFRLTPDS